MASVRRFGGGEYAFFVRLVIPQPSQRRRQAYVKHSIIVPSAGSGVPLCDSSVGRGGIRLMAGAVTRHGEQHLVPSSGKGDAADGGACACLRDFSRVGAMANHGIE